MTARGNSRNTNSSMISETGCTEFSPRPIPFKCLRGLTPFLFQQRGGTVISLGCHWLASAFPFSLPMKVAWIIKTFPTLATWCP